MTLPAAACSGGLRLGHDRLRHALAQRALHGGGGALDVGFDVEGVQREPHAVVLADRAADHPLVLEEGGQRTPAQPRGAQAEQPAARLLGARAGDRHPRDAGEAGRGVTPQRQRALEDVSSAVLAVQPERRHPARDQRPGHRPQLELAHALALGGEVAVVVEALGGVAPALHGGQFRHALAAHVERGQPVGPAQPLVQRGGEEVHPARAHVNRQLAGALRGVHQHARAARPRQLRDRPHRQALTGGVGDLRQHHQPRAGAERALEAIDDRRRLVCGGHRHDRQLHPALAQLVGGDEPRHVLDRACDHALARPQAEPAEHDVEGVAGAARDRDLAAVRPQQLADQRAQALCLRPPVVHRLARGGPGLGLERQAAAHGVHDGARERAGPAGVEVGVARQHRELRAQFQPAIGFRVRHRQSALAASCTIAMKAPKACTKSSLAYSQLTASVRVTPGTAAARSAIAACIHVTAIVTGGS